VAAISVLRLALAYAAFLSVTPACGLFSSRNAGSARAPLSARVLVAVESHNWSDITVYLIAGGLPQRLGMVTALGSATFDFASQRLNTSGGVRLRALPVAGRAYTTETIPVLPGQVISWTLENDLNTSSFSVY
jgi:hypothetical protein